MNIYIKGLYLGLAYVAPIGIQNLFMIQSTLKGTKLQTLTTLLGIILSDISLAFACFFGIGYLLNSIPSLKTPVFLAGVIFMLYISYSLIFSNSFNKDSVIIPNKASTILLSCVAVTWLNPQAIIDGTILFGGIRSVLNKQTEILFILGFSSASILWFSSLTLIITLTKKVLNERVLLFINKLCGTMILFFIIYLVFTKLN